MKKVLIILLSLITAFAVWFGVSYACKGVAKSWVDTWKGNNQIEEPEEPEQPEEPGDVVEPEQPEEPEHVHAFKNVLSYDDTYHFYVCEDETCNEVKDKAEHVYNWVIDTPASTFSAGVKHEECECGIKRNENTPIEEVGLTSVLNVIDTERILSNAETSSEMQIYDNGPWNEVTEEFYTMIYDLDFTLDESSVNYFTFGTVFRLGSDTRLMLRYSASSAAQASFDIMIGGARYRLMNEDVTNLVLDVLENKTLSVEVGSTMYNDVVYFGFKFTSQNYELCFTSLNNGNLTKETELFLATGSNSTSGDTCTLYSLISSYEYKCITRPVGSGMGSIIFVSYADTEASTTLNVDNNSAWFNNVVKNALIEKGHNYVDDNEFTE